MFNQDRLAQISNWKNTFVSRQDRIKREGSEYFIWLVPATAAAAISQINVGQDYPRAKKWEPLDFIEVCNNDVVNISLIINNDIVLPVPNGTIRTVKNQAMWQIGIRNDDAAVASTLNSIVVNLRRLPITVDDWARRQR
jgi:hypothetical protein